MKKDEAKKFLVENFLKRKNLTFLPKIHLPGCDVDFLLHKNGKWMGIFVKGDFSKEALMIGELINCYRFLSHVILCGSKQLVQKVMKIITTNPEIQHLREKLGTIAIDRDEITFKEPKNSRYYFYVKKLKQANRYRKFPKYGRLDEKDISILNLVKERKVITLQELSKKLNSSYNSIRNRIINLEHFNHIKILSKFPITITVCEDEKRTSDTKV